MAGPVHARRFHPVKKLPVLLGAAVTALAALALVRTVRYTSTRTAVERAPEVPVPEGAAERLAGAVRIATISHENPADLDADAFQALHAHLHASFPRVHAELQRETVGTHSLLYTWRGSDPSLDPVLLSGHLDVVPVEPGTEERWQHATARAAAIRCPCVSCTSSVA